MVISSGNEKHELIYSFHLRKSHFARNDLPRIRYANPSIEIQVNKVPKSVGDTWRPEMQLEFRTSHHPCVFSASNLKPMYAGDGTTKTIDLQDKWSTTIFQDVMDLAGGNNWERWKRERKAAGLPIVEYAPAKPTIEKTMSDYSDLFTRLDRPKTGAAAVLP